MKTQKTATIFWKLFKEQSKQNPKEYPEEHMRHACILGLTAMDAALYTYWESAVLPEWGEFMTLVNTLLEDEEALSQLLLQTKSYMKKSQLVATLRFLNNTGEAERFTPNFLDFSVYVLTRFGHLPWSHNLAQNLSALHKLRNAALHTGREWNLDMAKDCVRKLENTSGSLLNLGNNFAEAFSEDSRDYKVIPLKKVA
jgi:hypothetical protein